MVEPIVYDLFTGLHGWLEAFLLEGYRCVGFDTADMCAEIGHARPEGVELRIRDVRSIHGSELKDATCIVGSSPCQEFSYRGMPWKRAKALPPPYLGMELFNAQFRIQREASEAAGRHIPMVVENVCKAQKWVGRAQWHYGSYYLWGDVPALMPMTFKGFKSSGMNWSDQTKRGQDFTRIAGQQAIKNDGGSWFNVAHNTTNGKGDKWFQDGAARHGSRSRSRKAASAMIAKIPFPLALHIARCFKPVPIQEAINA